MRKLPLKCICVVMLILMMLTACGRDEDMNNAPNGEMVKVPVAVVAGTFL